MYALYYNISMLGKPLVFVKALSCVPYLRSQCYGSTLFPRRRPSQWHEGLENVHSTLCVSPTISREKELELRGGTTLLVTQKQTGSERSVVPFHFKLMED